jgi:hypothetical protein
MKRFLKIYWVLLVVVAALFAIDIAFGQPEPDTTGNAAKATNAVTLITIGFNLLMGILSVPLTELVKKFIPFLANYVIPIVNAAIGVALCYAGFWLFHLSIFDNPDFFKMAITALGVNATAAQVFYEWLQGRKKAA